MPPHVKRMLFDNDGGMGDVMRVVYRYMLIAPHTELVGSQEGKGYMNMMRR